MKFMMLLLILIYKICNYLNVRVLFCHLGQLREPYKIIFYILTKLPDDHSLFDLLFNNLESAINPLNIVL